MDVAIIILCWRHNGHLPALLQSIARQSARHRFVTVLCVNAKQGEIEPAAGWNAPPHHRIYSGGNFGYGGGNNFAIAWARQKFDPRYFLVLNNDVVLTDGALDALLSWADARPALGIIGAVQTNPGDADSSPQIGCRYNPAFSLIRRTRMRDGGRIDYVNGGAVLLRATAFPDDPVFAERYFLFFEELELTLRARSMGHGTDCCPDCLVLHLEGATREGVVADDFCPEVSEYFENLNALRFTRERYPRYLPSVLLFRLIVKFVRLVSRGELKRLTFWYLALADFFRGRVRRFPFQRGWQPRDGRDAVIDAELPCRP